MRLVCGLLLLLTAVGCSPIQVGVDYDPEADFSGLLSYDWAALSEGAHDPRVDNDLLKSRLQAAVNTELATKGFVLSGDAPDFVIGYHAAIEQRIDVREVVTRRYGYRGGWYDDVATHVREYDEGTLILDIVEAERNQLVWRGTAKGEVDLFAKPEEKAARIQEAVQKLLADFPPGGPPQ